MKRKLSGEIKVFPSPLGVSYFQMWILSQCCENGIKFPSPLGVSYFQIESLAKQESIVKNVSVPSRGILFPNNNTVNGNPRWRFLVSVPSRGILFPNTGRLIIVYSIIKGFRPLSGYLISKL